MAQKTETRALRQAVDDYLAELPGILDMTLAEYFASVKRMTRPQRTALRKYGAVTVFDLANNRPYDFAQASARANLAEIPRRPVNHLSALRTAIDNAAGNLAEFVLKAKS